MEACRTKVDWYYEGTEDAILTILSSVWETSFDPDQGTLRRTLPDQAPAPTYSSACKGRNRPFRHSCTSLAKKTQPQSDHSTPTLGTLASENFFTQPYQTQPTTPR